MNVKYPSLNEAYYYKYKTTNKLSKTYNRWKLKYSPDENPYITNMSFAFSYCNSSNYNYGAFPIIENSSKPVADIDVDDLQYDITDDNFIRFMNNHVSSWYTISDDPMSMKDDKDAFVQVNNDTVYYKGILYSLKTLYDTYPDMKHIDKFGVFVNPDITVNSNIDDSSLKYVKYVIDRNIDGTANADTAATITYDEAFGYSSIFINAYNYDANIYNNEFFTYNAYGVGEYIEFDDFDQYNRYYRKHDIVSLFGAQFTDYIFNKVRNDYPETLFEDDYGSLPIGLGTNIVTGDMNIITNSDDFTSMQDSIYISPSTTSSKYKYDGIDTGLQTFFLHDSFITAYEFARYTYSYYPEFAYNISKLPYWNYVVQDIDDVIIDKAILSEVAAGEKVASPGMKYKHYSPKADVTIVKGDDESFEVFAAETAGAGVWFMTFGEKDTEACGANVIPYGETDEEQAERLFEVLRELDDAGAERVFARCPRETGVGLAVYNRLLRAAGFKVIEL